MLSHASASQVRGYAQAGFAGILIEDQVAPKQCGHMRTRQARASLAAAPAVSPHSCSPCCQVISRAEAVARVRAACDARDAGSDIVVVARSDARSAISLDEALWRAAAFADAVRCKRRVVRVHALRDACTAAVA